LCMYAPKSSSNSVLLNVTATRHIYSFSLHDALPILFEHLMFNGSENAPGDFFEPLQDAGATDFNGTTNPDRTNYFQTVPTGALELALFLESDRMGHLLGAVTQEKLDNQRGVVQNEKRQGDNQPFGLLRY